MTIHVLDQLPLWVEGDLNAPELAAIEGHLAECPGCRAAGERLRASQAWLREAAAAPFTASDVGAFHRAVMDQVRAEAAAKPIRRLPAGRGLLGALAASLLIATALWRRERPVAAPAPGLPAPATAPNPKAASAPEASLHPALRGPARIVSAPAHPDAAGPPAGPAPGAPIRIELQTADPTIRIIWLAQARPLPDAEPPHPEEP